MTKHSHHDDDDDGDADVIDSINVFCFLSNIIPMATKILDFIRLNSNHDTKSGSHLLSNDSMSKQISEYLMHALSSD